MFGKVSCLLEFVQVSSQRIGLDSSCVQMFDFHRLPSTIEWIVTYNQPFLRWTRDWKTISHRLLILIVLLLLLFFIFLFLFLFSFLALLLKNHGRNHICYGLYLHFVLITDTAVSSDLSHEWRIRFSEIFKVPGLSHPRDLSEIARGHPQPVSLFALATN